MTLDDEVDLILREQRVEGVTHAGENLLSRLRNGDLTLNQPRTNALLSLVDAVREMLAAIEQEGVEGNEEHDAVLTALNAAMLDDESAEEVVTAALDELATRIAAATPSSSNPDPASASVPTPEPIRLGVRPASSVAAAARSRETRAPGVAAAG